MLDKRVTVGNTGTVASSTTELEHFFLFFVHYSPTDLILLTSHVPLFNTASILSVRPSLSSVWPDLVSHLISAQFSSALCY